MYVCMYVCIHSSYYGTHHLCIRGSLNLRFMSVCVRGHSFRDWMMPWLDSYNIQRCILMGLHIHEKHTSDDSIPYYSHESRCITNITKTLHDEPTLRPTSQNRNHKDVISKHNVLHQMNHVVSPIEKYPNMQDHHGVNEAIIPYPVPYVEHLLERVAKKEPYCFINLWCHWSILHACLLI